ncbi:uncharacterized protein LTR77_011156 [Saxophila tyrrhenica]|uniref:Uncharacterized protein n=1 Tax=Saxophila tyrrhenica TaxID=1690608 RepID=A0AAV9NTX1_9PEZI|nr:hypothetical protein LTR77_011156 [Saxophila tyrrhenica]
MLCPVNFAVAWFVVEGVLVLASPLSLPMCSPALEGSCRRNVDPSILDICASGAWQRVSRGTYDCVAGIVQTKGPSVVVEHNTTTLACKPAPEPSLAPNGYSFCTGIALSPREDRYGRASYRPGGRMASVYNEDVAFRCDLAAPPDGYYVALWTQYTDHSIPQPPPTTCGQTLSLTNPKLNRTATATVIDRCASCVGVGRRLNDRTTPDCLVNGATVDVSPALWNFLFDNAIPSVYDIEYEGDVYAGWPVDPARLDDMDMAECRCG